MKVNIYEAVLADMDLSHYRGAQFRFEGDDCYINEISMSEEQLSFLDKTGLISIVGVVDFPHGVFGHNSITVGNKTVYLERLRPSQLEARGFNTYTMDIGQDPRLLSSSYMLETSSHYGMAIFPSGHKPDMMGWRKVVGGRWRKE